MPTREDLFNPAKINDRLCEQKVRSLAPRTCEGGVSLSRLTGGVNRENTNSPSQKSEIFASPLCEGAKCGIFQSWARYSAATIFSADSWSLEATQATSITFITLATRSLAPGKGS